MGQVLSEDGAGLEWDAPKGTLLRGYPAKPKTLLAFFEIAPIATNPVWERTYSLID